jgi:hypothetical protein
MGRNVHVVPDGNDRAVRKEGASHASVVTPTKSEALDPDALTAGVFERLSYLPPQRAWQLLSAAMTPLNGLALAALPPAGDLTWHFWKSFRAATSDARRVEPDVVIEWGGQRLRLVEAKHHGSQAGEQWLRELEAVLNERISAGRELSFIAAGGTSPQLDPQHARVVSDALGSRCPGLFALPWPSLWVAAVDALRTDLGPGERAVITDLGDILDTWGYRRRAPRAADARHAARLRKEPCLLCQLRRVNREFLEREEAV